MSSVGDGVWPPMGMCAWEGEIWLPQFWWLGTWKWHAGLTEIGAKGTLVLEIVVMLHALVHPFHRLGSLMCGALWSVLPTAGGGWRRWWGC